MDKDGFYTVCDWFGLTRSEADFIWAHRPFDGDVIPDDLDDELIEDLVCDLAPQIIRARNAGTN